MSEHKPIRSVALQFLAEPTDVNFGGKVHGGTVMKWIDQAGYACAAGWSGGYCVTVYVGGIQFIRPIHIGMLVEVSANVIYTGRSSMHIAVDVFGRHPTDPEQHKTTHCDYFCCELMNTAKRGRSHLATGLPRDQALENYAQKLMKLRESIDTELKAFKR